MEALLEMAMTFIQGVGESSAEILEWLITPIGIGEWSIAPFTILLPSSVGIFLLIVGLQLLKKTI